MDKVRIGIIGVGYLGTQHARILSYLEEAELKGVADIDFKKAVEIGNRHGVEYFENFEDMLDEIDAAIVATPTSEHFSISMRLLNEGKSVLVEKPITETVEQAEQLVAKAKKSRAILQVGHLERFNPAVEAIENVISEPKFIEVQRLGSFSARSLDIDVVLDLMIHDLDIILALIKDEVKVIRSSGIHVLSEKIDIANARLEFKSGCVATLTASRVHQGKVRKLRIFEPTSCYSVDYINQEVKIFPLNGKQTDIKSLKIEKEEPLKKELKNFFQCIKEGKTKKVSGEEALRALRLAYSVLREAEA
ncbi:MAG: Gfo/Idh/MocA family oxidoreductase [Candidatus Aminicenantes bacterium]|nr:Gfo/Idh/MocA family oxidoreductase [Candidatus Aminicenantes bacterium]MDH5706243.1 Gfo/Idh/MocA family oxidoreductase [Candidatus Aminicenantes bacterium]